jgi:hypothetical protein
MTPRPRKIRLNPHRQIIGPQHLLSSSWRKIVSAGMTPASGSAVFPAISDGRFMAEFGRICAPHIHHIE